MTNSLAISVFLLAFFASITFNGFFRTIARNNNFLIDIPDKSRHFHDRATPLTGGLGIFFGILVSGLLLTGLTGANQDIDFTNNVFIENSKLSGSVSKNYEVSDKDYELSLSRTNNNEISVQINHESSLSNQHENTNDIVSLSNNKFKAILPNGEEKYYLIESGNVIEISKSNEEINVFQRTQSARFF